MNGQKLLTNTTQFLLFWLKPIYKYYCVFQLDEKEAFQHCPHWFCYL